MAWTEAPASGESRRSTVIPHAFRHRVSSRLYLRVDSWMVALSQKPSLADRASTRGSRPSRMSGVESISTVGHAMRHSDRSLYHFTN